MNKCSPQKKVCVKTYKVELFEPLLKTLNLFGVEVGRHAHLVAGLVAHPRPLCSGRNKKIATVSLKNLAQLTRSHMLTSLNWSTFFLIGSKFFFLSSKQDSTFFSLEILVCGWKMLDSTSADKIGRLHQNSGFFRFQLQSFGKGLSCHDTKFLFAKTNRKRFLI